MWKIILPDFRFSRWPSSTCFGRFMRNDRRRTRPTFPGSIDFLSDRKKFFISVKFIFYKHIGPINFHDYSSLQLSRACCLLHARPSTGLKKLYFRVYCFSLCFLHNFKITTAPYVSPLYCDFCHSVRLFISSLFIYFCTCVERKIVW